MLGVWIGAQGAQADLKQQDFQKQKQIYFLKSQLHQLEQEEVLKKANQSLSGFFAGGGVGAGTFGWQNSFEHPLMWALKAGYHQIFSTSSMGVRSYVEYDWISYPVKPLNFYHTGSLNLDLTADFLLDKPHRYGIGFFAGLGLGGIYYHASSGAFGRWSGFFNLGCSAVLNIRHRVEFSLRLPLDKALNVPRAKNLFFVNYLYKF